MKANKKTRRANVTAARQEVSQHKSVVAEIRAQQVEFLQTLESGMIQHFNSMLSNLNANIPAFVKRAVEETLVEILQSSPEALDESLREKAELIERHTVDLQQRIQERLATMGDGVGLVLPNDGAEALGDMPQVVADRHDQVQEVLESSTGAQRIERLRQIAYGDATPSSVESPAEPAAIWSHLASDATSPSGEAADVRSGQDDVVGEPPEIGNQGGAA
jgi:hypothetical protein